MLLREFSELWGIPLDEIRKQGRKYRIYSSIIYVVDFILVIISGIYMFRKGSSFSNCVLATVFITLLCFMILNLVINPVKWRAYLFYRKHKNCSVKEVPLYLKVDNMRSILYCSNYKRKKLNGTIPIYKELMLSACCEDSVYSKRLGKLLVKFKESTDGTEEVKAFLLRRGRRTFLIGFKDDISE